MSQTIQIKRTAVANTAPSTLLPGELACNITDGRLFLGDEVEDFIDVGFPKTLYLSGATSDVLLQIGQTAVISYTDALSVPLHISSGDSIFEIYMYGKYNITSSNSNAIFLQPNNTTYSNLIYHTMYALSGGSPQSYYSNTEPAFNISEGVLITVWLILNTATESKSVKGRSYSKNPSNYNHRDAFLLWNDFTTPWESLGTIVFPFQQSGRIIIKRLS